MEKVNKENAGLGLFIDNTYHFQINDNPKSNLYQIDFQKQIKRIIIGSNLSKLSLVFKFSNLAETKKFEKNYFIKFIDTINNKEQVSNLIETVITDYGNKRIDIIIVDTDLEFITNIILKLPKFKQLQVTLKLKDFTDKRPIGTNNQENQFNDMIEITTDKLKVEEVSPYLPYGLQVDIQGVYHNLIGIESNYFIIKPNKHTTELSFIPIFFIKPILRPVNRMFVKNSVKGIKGVTPFDYFWFEVLGSDKEMFDYSELTEMLETDISINFAFAPKILIDFLLKHHFDIFGLLDRDLAINFYKK